jgi:hypothetical protein
LFLAVCWGVLLSYMMRLKGGISVVTDGVHGFFVWILGGFAYDLVSKGIYTMDAVPKSFSGNWNNLSDLGVLLGAALGSLACIYMIRAFARKQWAKVILFATAVVGTISGFLMISVYPAALHEAGVGAAILQATVLFLGWYTQEPVGVRMWPKSL